MGGLRPAVTRLSLDRQPGTLNPRSATRSASVHVVRSRPFPTRLVHFCKREKLEQCGFYTSRGKVWTLPNLSTLGWQRPNWDDEIRLATAVVYTSMHIRALSISRSLRQIPSSHSAERSTASVLRSIGLSPMAVDH